jgi:hypothetical protein
MLSRDDVDFVLSHFSVTIGLDMITVYGFASKPNIVKLDNVASG